MKTLTEQEYKNELDQGTGVMHFIGGTSSKNGKMVLLVGDEMYLFESNEIGNDYWNELIKKQEIEAKEYIKGIYE